ncbi:cysteine hydrolase family protein [Spelaeicoccus albus]|uniref:Nicotinamidase-related amidase n=1 Tax=Spelaeicoccus albus TaxID=1280376 RepID=A0A7Z0ABL9_9MICO|nr:cysteine hydrolase family protein [Spelaeicoccus albus]NYI67140.1 nicotinamidase-related amidase [Spelaeicoccus albus]
MTTLEHRPNSALLVVDVQQMVVAEAHNRDAVVANIAALVDKARAAGTDVIWVQNNSDELPRGSDGWQLVPELSRLDSEPLVDKQYADAFEATDLEAVLAARAVGSLIVVGAETDQCIRSTLHGGFARGYDAVLVSDAHTTNDLSDFGAPPPEQVIAHTNLYWTYQEAPRKTGGTVATDEVSFAV